MGKDVLEYRHSRRWAHESDKVEGSIGITELRSRRNNYSKNSKFESSNVLLNSESDAIMQRPVGLLKWSFDDFIVEEILPSELPCKSIMNRKEVNGDHFICEPTNKLHTTPNKEKEQIQEHKVSTTETATILCDVEEKEIETVSSSSNNNAKLCRHQMLKQQQELQLFEQEEGERNNYTLLIRVISEGVPDSVIERSLRHFCNLSANIPIHFLTPIDFVSSALRYVWIRACNSELCARFTQQLRIPCGKKLYIYVNECLRLNVSASSLISDRHNKPTYASSALLPTVNFPLCYLPNTRYTVLIRNVRGSLGDVLHRLRSLSSDGFINYSHLARHGVGLFRSFEDGKRLLTRQYNELLCSYVRNLAEGALSVERELPILLDVLADPHSSVKDWKSVSESMLCALNADHSIMQYPCTGLYAPHHALLKDFVQRASDIAPIHHDSAQLIRATISRRVLQEKMHTLSEVCFNALASLRWRQCGDRVVPGDLVAINDTRWSQEKCVQVVNNKNYFNNYTVEHGNTEEHCLRSRHKSSGFIGDVYEGTADHVNGFITSDAHQDWVALAEQTELKCSNQQVHCVRDYDDAKRYSIEQVVLPCWGRGIGTNYNANNVNERSVTSTKDGMMETSHMNKENVPFLFPKFNVSGEVNVTVDNANNILSLLAHELQIESMPLLKIAPHATYRHLIRKPRSMSYYICDEQRGWDWAEGTGALALKQRLYRDEEGILRLSSPLAQLAKMKSVARFGIAGQERRAHFCKPARKNGMTCVIQMTLPRGSPVTSALREVFQLATLSPAALFRLFTENSSNV